MFYVVEKVWLFEMRVPLLLTSSLTSSLQEVHVFFKWYNLQRIALFIKAWIIYVLFWLHFCFSITLLLCILTFITILYGLIVLGLVGTVARGSTLRITTPAEEYWIACVLPDNMGIASFKLELSQHKCKTTLLLLSYRCLVTVNVLWLFIAVS